MPESIRSKIPPRRIPSDSCVVSDRGELFYPHTGEWIEMRPIRSIRDQLDILHLRDLGNGTGADMVATEARLKATCEALAKQITGWNWTDDEDKPMDQPHERPDVLLELSNEELTWIITQAMSVETGDERKNV